MGRAPELAATVGTRAGNEPLGSPRLGSVHERAEPGSARQFGELAEEARLEAGSRADSSRLASLAQNIYYAVSI